jgi:Carboxypeptidase regulatory-like domain
MVAHPNSAKTTMLFVLTFVALCLAVPRVGWAQGGATGAIAGTVLDPSGGVIPNAAIQIVDAGTGQAARNLITNSSGSFIATLLPPGAYTVVVNAPGFGEGRVNAVAVRVTETTTLNVVLKPGSVSQKVEVSAQVVTINTENPTTGQTIEHEELGGLPLATRNFQQLLTLSTGASSALNNSEQLGRGNVRINVNGQREDNNNYLIEGVSATDYNVGELTNTPLPSPDVVQEFKVQTSLYDASQGRNGGGMVNAVLRTGTNEWHGDAFEFFRNDVLNANDFFLNRAGQSRPVLKQNIFGGSVGGPLGSEGHFGYIFGNYQGSRQRSGADLGTIISTSIPIIPADRTAQSLSKAFSCPNAPIQIDPVVLKLFNFKSNQFGGSGGGFLVPSIAGTPGVVCDPTGTKTLSVNSGSFVFSSPGRFTDDQFTTNWDREFHNHKEKLAARFFFSNSDSLKPFGGGGLTTTFGAPPSKTDLNFPLDVPINTRFLNGTWTHIFAGDRINQFLFGYVRINNAYTNVPFITAADLGINRPTNSVTKAIYKFTFNTSGFQLGPDTGDQSQVQNNYVFNDVFSWVHASHQFRFGGEFDRINLHKLFPQIFNGQIFFNTGGGLTDFQSFLLGAPTFVFGQSGVSDHDYHHNNLSGFAQDDWKAMRNLTLNLGLRVEAFGAWYDNLFHIGNVDPALLLQGQYPYIFPSGVNKFNVPGLRGTANSTTLNNTYTVGLGPRLGLAYDVFGHHTTTIRAGYGIYYVQQDVGNVDQLSFSSPLLDVVFSSGPPGCLANLFELTTPPPCPNPNPNGLPAAGVISPAFVPVVSQVTEFAVNGSCPPCTKTSDTSQTPVYNNNSVNLFALQVPRHFRVPSVQQWNLTVQRSLGHNWVLETGYVGAHTTHLRETHDALQSALVSTQNPLTITGANGQQFKIFKNTVANALARSRFQGINGYGGFEIFADDAYAHYDSLQLTLSRRWANNYFQAAYTFGRSTDATSSFNTAFNTVFNNQLDLNGSRGLSDFDRKHRLAVSYLYNLPVLSQATGWKSQLLANWSFSGVSVFQSGLPFSILDSGAGTAFDMATTVMTTANLAPGATRASGLTSGGVGSRLNNYVNFNAFAKAPIIGDDASATGFGTLGRNIYRGPFQQNWDFSLIKYFKITERQKIRFSTDFFDIWNHPAFSSPAFTDVQNQSAFGSIISTENNPRIIQFSLTWSF